MDLEGIILSEIKSDRERQILYEIIYMWNLKNKTTSEYSKKKIKKKQVHRYREKNSGYQWGERGGNKRGVGD